MPCGSLPRPAYPAPLALQPEGEHEIEGSGWSGDPLTPAGVALRCESSPHAWPLLLCRLRQSRGVPQVAAQARAAFLRWSEGKHGVSVLLSEAHQFSSPSLLSFNSRRHLKSSGGERLESALEPVTPAVSPSRHPSPGQAGPASASAPSAAWAGRQEAKPGLEEGAPGFPGLWVPGGTHLMLVSLNQTELLHRTDTTISNQSQGMFLFSQQ